MASGSSLKSGISKKMALPSTKTRTKLGNVSSTTTAVQKTKIKFMSANGDKRGGKTRAKSPLLIKKTAKKHQQLLGSEKESKKGVDHNDLTSTAPSYIKDLEKAFSLFDKDRDGSITKSEIRVALKEADIKFTDRQLDVFMSKLDKDGNGDVDYEEFCTLMRGVVGTAYRRDSIMRDTFKQFDVNGDGNISQSELRSAIGDNMTDTEADEVIRLADKNGDGEINYDEFTTMVHMLDLTPN